MTYRSRFRRGRVPTYRCDVCGRLTRAVDCEHLCPECWELAGEDNHYNDTGTVPTAEELARFDKMVAAAAKKGSDPDKMRASCGYIWRN